MDAMSEGMCNWVDKEWMIGIGHKQFLLSGLQSIAYETGHEDSSMPGPHFILDPDQHRPFAQVQFLM